jgi:adenylate cyclase
MTRAAGKVEGAYGRLKLLSGLVLFTFLGTHLLNHALGLIALDAAEAGAVWFKALWRNPLGTLVLYTAFLLHPLLALFNWLRRGHYRGLPWQAWTQLLLGLCLPPLVILHIVGTRGLASSHGFNDSYAALMTTLFVQDPLLGLRQNLMLLIAWGHGCIGVYYWLRLKPAFERLWPLLFAAALLLPACAMLGYLSMGRAVRFMLRDPDWYAAFIDSLNYPGEAAVATAYRVAEWGQTGSAALLLAALVGRLLWGLIRRRHGQVTLTYPGGRHWRGNAGSLSLLEASRAIGFPHAAVCGGQGRCSTCRVKLSGPGMAMLPPPSDSEAAVLERIAAPPGVRLACQVTPVGDLTVVPLLPAGAGPRAAYGGGMTALAQGSERRIAILFCDLRGFTQFSEARLPFDVVFVLNQYFKAMGEAVEASGGRLDKFIGDGVMALFGLENTPADACRQALVAADAMGRALAQLNETLRASLGQVNREAPELLRIGIGIHCGRVIVGEMGHGRATGLTAVGDAVNTASRLESATKDFAAELVVSAEVTQRAGLSPADLQAQGWREETVTLRGKSEALQVFVCERLARQ